ncbi:aromatic ring-hydroxylating dioxygenase subunit alpha [Maritimibacter sp. DP1N21-5]|uniref:aromatic ring-hydroxylating dioxygenase subunit alpha n=1 Tax=Maritimibacter sp. DP1N21-5 TaxID=2836867 RepID=UPI001C43AB25|nr:aromatic ring-hydroxylating dioxygenase subunit alpha [Maritimibacter sp. DP1N21-5]MBV7407385.1 aromatic ring-hydroxylating dioxygenase subunit alpha [Maritimibacter sp. DP1N21-5]
MISAALNDRLTRIGPGTPAGAVLRQYWQPAALVDELAHGPLVPVNLMGERLVLVQGDQPHLATRFVAPDEPPTHYPASDEIEIDEGGPTYPVDIRAGAVWAYLGEGAPPPFPNFDCFRAPETHVFAFKGLWECNWLQALEIGIDPAHASFLHRFLEDEDPSEGYGRQFRDKAGTTEIPMTKLLRDYPRPDIQVDDTDYGLKITALRHMEDGRTHVRVTNQIFPDAICIPMSREMTITQWHVPVDDVTTYWFTVFTSFDKPVNKDLMREQRLKEHRLPDYAPLKNRANDYQYDPEEQARLTYTGMGLDINVHDQWAVEGMGAIQDRTQEHLGRSDVAIIRYRRLLRRAMDALETGEAGLPMQDADAAMIRGPLSNDAIGDTADWETASHQADLARRSTCPWDATV